MPKKFRAKVFSKKVSETIMNPHANRKGENLKMKETIYIAGGCLWGVQHFIRSLPGVIETEAGRANGSTNTLDGEYDGYAECVKTVFDPAQVSVNQLMDYFFEIIDPYSINKQGIDEGPKYRTGIYSENEKHLEEARKYIDLRDGIVKFGKQLSCNRTNRRELRNSNIDEHILIAHDLIYSCENNKEVQEKIKTFPTLYFEIKEYNLTFLFNYKELFKLHNNRLYFLVSFKNDSETWVVGEIFFRKYLTSFDYYSKTIAFYTTQIDNINKKTDIVSPDEPDSDDKSDDPDDGKDNLKIRIIIYVVVGVVIIAAIVIITLLLIKLKKNRKKRARELNDDYEYIPENKVN